MLKTAFTTTFVALLSLSTAAMAQETAATQETAETETPAETGAASEIESQLNMGEDADTPVDLGKLYTKETNGAWEIRCVRTENPETDPCQMYQLMKDSEGTPVAEFTLFRLPDGGKAKAGATVTVPLETALPNQLKIAIDGGKGKRYPYAFCNPVGCYSRVGLTAEDVAAFKRGNKAVLTLVPALALDQTVELDLSLDGFTASFDKVSVIRDSQ